VGQTLGQVFAEQEADELRDLLVEAVDPAPDGSHLLVTVRPMSAVFDPTALIAHLNGASADLRMEVAAAITRRRVPSFTFRVVPPQGGPVPAS
jgi:ribosome-binding factor A